MTLDVALVAQHLGTEVPALVNVGTARDLAAAQIDTIRFPSAFVILLSESAGAPKFENEDTIEQEVTYRIGVVLAVRDIADRSGAVAVSEVNAVRGAVLTAMGRYAPDGANTATRFARGQLASGIGRDGAMFWQDDFTVGIDRRIQIS